MHGVNIFHFILGNEWKWSNSSFLFSLQNEDRLPPFKAPVYLNYELAVYSDPNLGPTFGVGHNLCICRNAHIEGQPCSNFGITYTASLGYGCGSPETASLLAGCYNFTSTEIEVFY